MVVYQQCINYLLLIINFMKVLVNAIHSVDHTNLKFERILKQIHYGVIFLETNIITFNPFLETFTKIISTEFTKRTLDKYGNDIEEFSYNI